MAKLQSGDTLKSIYNKTYTVKRFIGEGTQGTVWEVSDGKRSMAVKWYTNADNKARAHFTMLVREGAPRDRNNKTDTRFIWPVDLVSKGEGEGFGYIMELVNAKKYVTLFKIINVDKYYPSHEIMCRMCANLADAFNNLHNTAWCYKDLSQNNIFFDIKTGEVLIVDIDNVVVSGEKGEIKGTPKFMAPEVVLDKCDPDRATDRFSLGVVYFYLFLGHNPLEGKLRDDYANRKGCIDDEGFKEIFGEKATFVFDEHNTRNNIKAPEYKYIVKRWNTVIPDKMKTLFNKTFVDGLSYDKRTKRATDFEWYKLFVEMEKGIRRCKCGEKYYSGAPKCAKCKNVLSISASMTKNGVLVMIKEAGNSLIKKFVFNENAVVQGKEIGNCLAAYSNFAEVMKNPNTGVLGLKNLSDLEWYYKDVGQADLNKVPSGKIVALNKGRIIAFIRRQIQIEVQ